MAEKVRSILGELKLCPWERTPRLEWPSCWGLPMAEEGVRRTQPPGVGGHRRAFRLCRQQRLGSFATLRRRRLWQANCRRRGRRRGLHWAGWRHDQGILGVGEGRGRLRRARYWRRLGSWQGRGRGKRLSPVGGGWGACDCKEGERGAGETVIGADGRICRCEEGVYWEPVVGGDCRACDREEAERSAGEQASGGWGASAANEGEGGSGLAFLPGGHYEIGVNHPGG